MVGVGVEAGADEGVDGAGVGVDVGVDVGVWIVSGACVAICRSQHNGIQRHRNSKSKNNGRNRRCVNIRSGCFLTSGIISFG